MRAKDVILNKEENIQIEESVEFQEHEESPSLPTLEFTDSFSSNAEVLRRSNTSYYPRPIQKLQPPPPIYDTSREPEDESDLHLHPHQKVYPGNGEKNCLRHGWQIIGASRRGYGHAYEGKYREDDFNVRLYGEDLALVAIADGVGSKAFSRRGARAAVLGATTLPEQRLQKLIQLIRQDSQNPRYQEEVYSTLIDAFNAAKAKVEQGSQEDLLDIDELHSTLLIFLVVPRDQQHLLIASLQIGDGALFVLQSNENSVMSDEWHWLQQPQIQESGNEVQPFMYTDASIWRNSFQCELLDNVTFIMGMTDGTADDIEPPRGTQENPNPDPFYYVNDFYQHVKSAVFKKAYPAEALLAFLGYRKRRSYDDRTVICLYRMELEER